MNDADYYDNRIHIYGDFAPEIEFVLEVSIPYFKTSVVSAGKVSPERFRKGIAGKVYRRQAMVRNPWAALFELANHNTSQRFRTLLPAATGILE